MTFVVVKNMKPVMLILLLLVCGSAASQNPWKNIYSQHAWDERDRWQKADRLVRLLRISKGSRVADIGSHEGYMTFKLAKAVGSEGLVYAIDIEEQRLKKVEAYADELSLTQIKAVKAQKNDPCLPADSLDAVMILDTYHEMGAHEEILQHIKRSLKSGGRLLICEPIADERRDLPREEQEKKHELSMDYALDDLKRAGFRIALQMDNYIDRTKQKGDRMWVVVAVKD